MTENLLPIVAPSTLSDVVAQRSVISTPLTRLESSVLPDKDFDDIILLVAETDLSKDRDPLSELMILDPTFDYLRNIMGESEDAIREEVSNAIKFFSNKLGIDVGSYERHDNMWVSGDHRFVSYYLTPNMKYRPVFTKERGSIGGEVREGGFALIIGTAGMIVHGTYGGTEGKFVPVGHIMLFGYYNIKFNDNTTRIFHYRSARPLISDLEHIFPIDNDVYDFGMKIWGSATGTSKTSIKETNYHLSVRNVITFPGNLHTGV